MNKPVLPLTYEQLDHWIESLQPALLAERFTMAIGILRGGAPLALMVSHAAGTPVAFLRYDRQSRTVAWDSTLPIPPAGSKVLLCEDIAGRGFTLTDCIAFLQQHGLDVRTLTAAVDDLSRTQPDYAIDARGYFALFPWERQAYTERYREDWERVEAGTAPAMAEDHEYATYAIDLDGILLPDVPLARYDEDLGESFDAAQQPPYKPKHETMSVISYRFTGRNNAFTGRPEWDSQTVCKFTMSQIPAARKGDR